MSRDSKSTDDALADEYLVIDLIGLAVVDKSGKVLGQVSNVIKRPGQDLLEVTNDGVTTLVPFVRSIAVEVDIAGHKVVLDPPGGLFAD